MYSESESEIRALILAPTGRDAQLLSATLRPSGIAVTLCKAVHHLLEELKAGAAFILAAEEALTPADIGGVSDWLHLQEPWSDLPVIVLTSGGHANVASVKKAILLRSLGNVTLIERPVRPDTILTAATAAVRARMRQYEMRRRQEILTRVNMDLEQFAYSASHDLQEPLRNVAIYSELLVRRYNSVLDREGQEFLAFLRTGALRMQLLVHDLLAYTQAASITEDVAQLLSADEALERALSNLSESIRQSKAEIDSQGLPRVRIQPIHLQQLFQNLIGNAIKYRGEEPPRIAIRCVPQDGRWLFSIRDNGIGIDPVYKERIFGIFKRLHTNEEYAGTGIGLALCQRIVERNSGRIWVESELGKGSTFYFSLPGEKEVSLSAGMLNAEMSGIN